MILHGRSFGAMMKNQQEQDNIVEMGTLIRWRLRREWLSIAWLLLLGCGCFWLGLEMERVPFFVRILLTLAGGVTAATILPPVLRKIQQGNAGVGEWTGVAAAAGTLWFQPLFWLFVGMAGLCDFLQQCFGGGYSRWVAALMGALPLTGCAWYAWAYEWNWAGAILLLGSWGIMVLTVGGGRWHRNVLWRFAFWFYLWTVMAAVAGIWKGWYGRGIFPDAGSIMVLILVGAGMVLIVWRIGNRQPTVERVQEMPPAARGYLAGYGALAIIVLVVACFPWWRDGRGWEWRKRQYELAAESFQPFCTALKQYRCRFGEWPETPEALRRIDFSPIPWKGRLIDFWADAEACRFLIRMRFNLEPLSGMMTATSDRLVCWRIFSARPIFREWFPAVEHSVSKIHSEKEGKNTLTPFVDVL